MAEESFQEKTEFPTPKRMRDARKEGNVSQSMDLGAAGVLMTGVLALAIMGPGIVEQLADHFREIYREMPYIELNPENLVGYFRLGAMFVLQLLAPFVLPLMFVGLLIGLMQTGWLMTTKTLKPDIKKISPKSGIKKMFSSKGLVELVKGLMKIGIIGLIAYYTIKSEIPRFIPLADQEITQAIATIGAAVLKLMVRIVLAILIIAILDYLYQKWKHKKDLRMTKQEVKDEMKQTEGDPKLKARIREVQIKTSLNRMIKKVPEADVVLANPVHVAVALKYDPESMAAPQVVAKGARKLAQKIKDIAHEHNIPVIEEPELARLLYRTVDVGWEIPFDLFQAVAEVLALVYRLRAA